MYDYSYYYMMYVSGLKPSKIIRLIGLIYPGASEDLTHAISKAASFTSRVYLTSPCHLTLRIHDKDGIRFTIDVDLLTLVSIKTTTPMDIAMQFCVAPTVKSIEDIGSLVSVSSKLSVIKLIFANPVDAITIFSNLEYTVGLHTPLEWDDLIRAPFHDGMSLTSSYLRAAAKVCTGESSTRTPVYELDPNSDEYNDLLQLVLRIFKIVHETIEEARARCYSDDDLFEGVCPGCGVTLTIGPDGFDKIKPTQPQQDLVDHTRCEKLDEDPSCWVEVEKQIDEETIRNGRK